MDLVQLFGSLAETIIEERIKNTQNAVLKFVLTTVPSDYYWDGSLGVSENRLIVFAKIGEKEIELAGNGERGSNYAGSQRETFIFGDLQELHDMPVIIQLAYLYRKYNKTIIVHAKYDYVDDWPGREFEEEHFELEFEFPSLKILKYERE